MTLFYTNPKILIESSNVHKMNNISSILCKQILNNINFAPNIIIKENYNYMLNVIFNYFKSFVNIYKFGFFNKLKIFIEIYNQDMIVVANVEFLINGKKYIYNSSDWLNFFIHTDKIKYSNVVYTSMNDEEKNNLRNHIMSGEYYFLDNIYCPIDSTTSGTGLIIKKSQLLTNMNIELIVGIYWIN